jgi:hypothetical protein
MEWKTLKLHISLSCDPHREEMNKAMVILGNYLLVCRRALFSYEPHENANATIQPRTPNETCDYRTIFCGLNHS